MTPNRDLTGHVAFWNVKIALNVAAIGCRHPGSLRLIADRWTDLAPEPVTPRLPQDASPLSP